MYDFCLTIPYGMIVGLGGLMGYVTAGSNMSLIAGGSSGAFLTLLGYASYNEYKQKASVSSIWAGLSLVISGALTGVMANRAYRTGAIFPAAFVSALSAGMTIFYIHTLIYPPKSKTDKKL